MHKILLKEFEANKMLKFSPKADYKTVLNRLKCDFDKKWKASNPSTADKIKDYEDIRVLGCGAFGVVVSLFCFFKSS